MDSKKRIILAVVILIAVTAVILVIDSFQRGGTLYRYFTTGEFSGNCVPIYAGTVERARFCSSDAEKLTSFSFTDKSEQKLQQGWFLCDIIKLYLKDNELGPKTTVTVESTARKKKAELRWKDLADRSKMVILAVSRQGTLKLVSTMEGLDSREQWIQEVDRIEVRR